MVGSLLSADSTVSLMWPNAPLASWTAREVKTEENETLLPRQEFREPALFGTFKTVLIFKILAGLLHAIHLHLREVKINTEKRKKLP